MDSDAIGILVVTILGALLIGGLGYSCNLNEAREHEYKMKLLEKGCPKVSCEKREVFQ